MTPECLAVTLNLYLFGFKYNILWWWTFFDVGSDCRYYRPVVPYEPTMGFCLDLEGGGMVGVVGATESQHQRWRRQHYGAWPRGMKAKHLTSCCACMGVACIVCFDGSRIQNSDSLWRWLTAELILFYLCELIIQELVCILAGDGFNFTQKIRKPFGYQRYENLWIQKIRKPSKSPKIRKPFGY